MNVVQTLVVNQHSDIRVLQQGMRAQDGAVRLNGGQAHTVKLNFDFPFAEGFIPRLAAQTRCVRPPMRTFGRFRKDLVIRSTAPHFRDGRSCELNKGRTRLVELRDCASHAMLAQASDLVGGSFVQSTAE